MKQVPSNFQLARDRQSTDLHHRRFVATELDPAEAMLSVYGLGMERNERALFTNIDLALSPSNILQITGENGSGKTSLLRIMAGLMEASSGEVLWQGNNIRQCRNDYHANMSYIGHTLGIKSGLTVRENLQLALNLARRKSAMSIDEALAQLNLIPYSQQYVERLSAGQQRRVALARLLILDTKLWLLDEPYTALDQSAIQWLNDRFLQHCQRGGIVIFTSHHPLRLANDHCQQLALSS